MVKLIGLLALVFLSHGQDERFFQKIYSRQEAVENREKGREYIWEAWGKIFRYDLNGDGLPEGLQMVKKDHEDWFYILGNRKRILAQYRLQTKGRESRVYRIKIAEMAKDLKLLTLYFYDGFVESSEFYGTATLYFITFNPSDFNSLKLTKGPAVWLEHETQIRYRQRDYGVKLKDLDRDGIKEVVVYQGHIRRIFQYRPKQGMVSVTI